MSSRRLPAAALALLSLVASLASASQARLRGGPEEVALHGAAESVQEPPRRLLDVRGLAVDAHGRPAVEAIVLSSAGGEGFTDARGRYVLSVRLPEDAVSLRITVVDVEAAASADVPVPAGTQGVTAPTLVLQEGTPSPRWLPTFGGQPGTDHVVEAFEVFDDGSGPALYAGGWFETAGGVPASFLARWDGISWTTVGGGLFDNIGTPPGVQALQVFDDGSGDALYVGGNFRRAGNLSVENIARWDGSSWSEPGSGTELYGEVYALEVFDDGGGEALYVGGNFDSVSGVAAANIAKWDGTAWSSMDGGTDGRVDAIASFDNGSGPALHIGGLFQSAGGDAAFHVARWDGADWRPMNRGTNGWVRTFEVFDDGGGAALYAGGYFTISDEQLTPFVARWDGLGWSPVGPGLDGVVESLCVYDDGAGPALHAGGLFQSSGGTPVARIARWDGGSWSPLGAGLNPGLFGSGDALAVWDDGNGEALFVGGYFTVAGDVPASHVARWDGAAWSSCERGLDGAVYALTTHDDGFGPALYAGGAFEHGSGRELHRVGRWQAGAWHPLGDGLDGDVNALCSFDDGSGPALFVGGGFTTAGRTPAKNLARWDGSGWSEVGGGVNGTVLAMLVHDDGSGPALYVAGFFDQVGTLSAASIARWDGSTWSCLGPVGSGVTSGSGSFATARSLCVFDDGSGPALYVAGSFFLAGGVSSRDLSRWDGATWSTVGTGVSSSGAYALSVHDDGSGPALYLGGQINLAGGIPVNSIARWDGATWSAVGSGVGTAFVEIRTLASFDDGKGPALYAGGDFLSAGGSAAPHFARWKAGNWQPMGMGLSDAAYAMHVHDCGYGPSLYVGGTFGSAPNAGESYLVRWGQPRSAPTGTYSIAGGAVPQAGR